MQVTGVTDKRWPVQDTGVASAGDLCERTSVGPFRTHELLLVQVTGVTDKRWPVQDTGVVSAGDLCERTSVGPFWTQKLLVQVTGVLVFR